MTNKEYADSLRMIADFYEQHEELALPYDAEQVRVYNVTTKEAMRPFVRAMGRCEKKFDDSFFRLCKMFGHIEMQVILDRGSVCKKIVVGTQKVRQRVPLTYQEVEVEQEIVNWDCQPAIDIAEFHEGA